MAKTCSRFPSCTNAASPSPKTCCTRAQRPSGGPTVRIVARSHNARSIYGEAPELALSLAGSAPNGWRLAICVTPHDIELADAFAERVPDLEPMLRLILEAAKHPAAKVIAEDTPSLTGREREILLALARGARPAEIAAERGVSEATVRNQVIAMRRKLGARSNAHAVAIAIHRGWLLIPKSNSEKEEMSGAGCTTRRVPGGPAFADLSGSMWKARSLAFAGRSASCRTKRGPTCAGPLASVAVKQRLCSRKGSRRSDR